jgi:hypothetical protein
MMERFRHGSSGTLGDLAGSLRRAYPDIFTGFAGAFPYILGCADRMQRHQVTGAFAGTLRGMASALTCTFPNITAAAANITAGAALMRLRL